MNQFKRMASRARGIKKLRARQMTGLEFLPRSNVEKSQVFSPRQTPRQFARVNLPHVGEFIIHPRKQLVHARAFWHEQHSESRHKKQPDESQFEVASKIH